MWYDSICFKLSSHNDFQEWQNCPYCFLNEKKNILYMSYNEIKSFFFNIKKWIEGQA